MLSAYHMLGCQMQNARYQVGIFCIIYKRKRETPNFMI